MKKLLFILLALSLWSIEGRPQPQVTSCVPGQPDTRFSWQRYDSGWAAVIGCKGSPHWEVTGIACRHGVCVQADWLAAMIEVGAATDPLARSLAWKKWWAVIVTTDCHAPAAADAAICAHATDWAKRMDADLNPVPPPPPVPSNKWVVAPTKLLCVAADKSPTGDCLKRFTYHWDGTTRGNAVVGTAAVGAVCDPNIGISPFFGVSATEVTTCQKQ